MYDNHARGDNDIFKDDDGDNHVKEFGEPRIPFVPGITFLHSINFMAICNFYAVIKITIVWLSGAGDISVFT